MADTGKRDDKAPGKPPTTQPKSPRDEAEPGTGENIDPKTGERFTEGIGGA